MPHVVTGIVAVSFGLLALISAYSWLIELAFLGFPDGRQFTALEIAKEKLYTTATALSVAMAGYFFYLAWISRKNTTSTKLFIAIALYLLFLGLVMFMDTDIDSRLRFEGVG